MVHERDDEYEGQEDGEYHFSDDQANYEMEPEVEKPTFSAAPAAAPKIKLPSIGDGNLNKFRRPAIGAAIIFALIFLIFKIISPSSNSPSVDFTQNSNGTTTVTQKTVKQTTVVAQGKKTSVSAPSTHPVEQAAPASAVVTEASRTPSALTLAPGTTTTTTTVSAPAVMPAQTTTPPAQTAVTTVTQQTAPLPAATNETSAQTASAVDKLIALQDQNTKLVNQLQAESAQKIADYEAQNIAMQGKMQDLNMRISSLETTIAHLTKLMQDMKTTGNSGGGNVAANNAVSRPAELTDASPAQQQMMARPFERPRSAFSVQAIIPGRAWLKADNGETVTVAEGDIIKNYGRITKIDPYDGVVQIDSGGKLLTLSYGAGAD